MALSPMNRSDHLWRANDALCLSLWSLIQLLDCKTIKVARKSRHFGDSRPRSEAEARMRVNNALGDCIMNLETGMSHLRSANDKSPLFNGPVKLARLTEIIESLEISPIKFRALPSKDIVYAAASIQAMARDCVWEGINSVHGADLPPLP